MSYIGRNSKPEPTSSAIPTDAEMFFLLEPLYTIRLSQLGEEKRITEEYSKSLENMMKSEDCSNGMLAFAIIDNFDKDEYNI